MAGSYARYSGFAGASGVTVYPNYAALPASASDGSVAVTSDTDNIYVYNAGSATWVQVGGPGTALSLGNLDAQAGTAKGAALVLGVLSMQSASASSPGLVNNTTQTFSGNKTFNGTTTALTTIQSAIEDASLNKAIDIANKYLWDYSVSKASVDWMNRVLLDTNGNTAINWENRRLFDVSGNESVYWTTRILVDNSGNKSVDWQDRLLQDSAGTTRLAWNTSGASISGVLNMNSNQINAVANGAVSSDAVNLGQLQAAVSGLTWKGPAQAYSASNVALAGSTPLVIDGYTVLNGDLVILGSQTTALQNGEYSVAISGSTYTLTSNGLPNAIGDAWLIVNGTTYADCAFVATAAVPSATFIEFAGPTAYTFSSPLSLSGRTVSISQANTSTSGYLSSADWNTFNGKGTGTVTSVSVASANGLAGTSSGGATPALTLSTTVTGILKGNGTAISAATSGTDYSPGTSGNATGLVKSTTGTGALTTAVAGTDYQAAGSYLTSITGDVVATGPGAGSAVIQPNVVFNSKLNKMNASTIKGNNYTYSANPSDLTVAQVNAMLGTLSNPMTTGGDIIYGGASGTPTRLANGSAAQYLASSGGTSAPAWTSFVAPTIQKFTSGSGTYTLPTSPRTPLYIRVRMVGGGGGGSGSGTGGSGGNGGTGGTTTFGTSLLSAGGGSGGTGGGGAGNGGSSSLGTGPIGISAPGNAGGIGTSSYISTGSGNVINAPGFGGQSSLGQFGSGGLGGSATIVNNLQNQNGGGGGAGGLVDAIISSPASTYAYSVGAAGTAGAAGTSGAVGFAGIIGIIEVTEYYQ